MKQASKKGVPVKICMMASSGGHLEEIKRIKINTTNNVYFVVTKNPINHKDEMIKYEVDDLDRKNAIMSILKSPKLFLEQWAIFKKEKPDVIITTGAGFVLPTCLYARFYGKKVVFIESIARVDALSKTGKIMKKISTLFIVQNKKLLKENPKAIYGGWLI